MKLATIRLCPGNYLVTVVAAAVFLDLEVRATAAIKYQTMRKPLDNNCRQLLTARPTYFNDSRSIFSGKSKSTSSSADDLVAVEEATGAPTTALSSSRDDSLIAF